MLTKTSAVDYATAWETLTPGGIPPLLDAPILFGAPDGTIAQTWELAYYTALHRLYLGVQPSALRIGPEVGTSLNYACNFTVNAYQNADGSWHVDNATQDAFIQRFDQVEHMIDWYYAPPGDPPAWQMLMALGPTNSTAAGLWSLVDFYVGPAGAFQVFGATGNVVAGNINAGNVSASGSVIATGQVQATDNMVAWNLSYHRSTAFFGAGDQSYFGAGSDLHMGAGAAHSQVLFLWDANQIIGNGNLTFDGASLRVGGEFYRQGQLFGYESFAYPNGFIILGAITIQYGAITWNGSFTAGQGVGGFFGFPRPFSAGYYQIHIMGDWNNSSGGGDQWYAQGPANNAGFSVVVVPGQTRSSLSFWWMAVGPT